MTREAPLQCGPWSPHEAAPATDSASIATVREHLIEAYLPGLPLPRHHRLLGSISLPEAVLVRLGSQTHRTDGVDELNTAFCREFLQTVIPADRSSLRLGRTDITGDLARIWCAGDAEHDDDTRAARVQSVHLAKVRQHWKITAIVTRAPHTT